MRQSLFGVVLFLIALTLVPLVSANTAPTINFVSIVPTSPVVQNNLSCKVNVTDPDQNSLNITFNWFKNGVNQTSLAGWVNASNNTYGVVSNVSSGLIATGQNWSCRVFANDGSLNSSTVNSSNVTILTNSAPNLTSVVINPSSPTPADNLSCKVNATDSQQSSLNITFNWFKNGVNQTSLAGSFNITNNTFTNVSTVLSGNLTTGNNWSCSIRVNDGFSNSSVLNSSNVTIGTSNTAPTINSATVLPSSPNASSNIYCQVNVTDSQQYLFNVSYSWFKNNVNQSALAGTAVNIYNNTNTNISGVSYVYLLSGDTWSCQVRANDGSLNSSTYSSSSVSISGSSNGTSSAALTINSAIVLPSTPTPSGNLYCQVLVTDSQQYTFNVSYSWFKNNVNQSALAGTAVNIYNNTNTNISGVSYVYLLPGDVWYCSVRATDGLLNSSPYSTSGVTISNASNGSSNTAPAISSTTVLPSSPNASSNLYCRVNATDSQQSSLTVYYDWFKNNVNQTGFSGSTTVYNNTYANISSVSYIYLYPGDTWYCSARANDGSLNSSVSSASGVTISSNGTTNTAPIIYSTTVLPYAPTTLTNLDCQVNAADSQQSSLNITYNWFKNGINQTSLAGAINVSNNTYAVVSSVPYTSLLSGDNWYCTAQANDGSLNSSVYYGSTVTINSSSGGSSNGSNTAPTVNSVTALPASPTIVNDLACQVVITDSQQTYLYVSYNWFKNGVNQTTLAGTLSVYNNTLANVSSVPYTYLLSGDTWYCSVRANDGMLNSSVSSSPGITVSSSVSNTAPNVASAMVLPATPNSFNNLACQVLVTDLQQSYLYVYYNWFKNGLNQSALAGSRAMNNNTHTNVSVVPYTYLFPGDNWYCSVQANDGFTNSSPYSSSIVTLNGSTNGTANTAPNVVSLNVYPAAPTPYTNLGCAVQAIDYQQSGLTAYYNWYKNGVNQPALAGSMSVYNNSYTALSNLLYGNLTAGDLWSCTVRVSDGSLDSSTYSTTNVTIRSSSANTAPYILSTNVYPFSPTLSSSLSCVVQASDYEQASLAAYYTWVRNGVNQTSLSGSLYVGTNTNSTVSTLPSSYLSAGNNWSCRVRVSDGSLISATVTSPAVTISSGAYSTNTAPLIYSTTISPYLATSESNLSCTVMARDYEQSSLAAYYSWYKNGVNQTSLAGSTSVVNSTYTTVSTLLSGNLSAGDVWSCSAQVYDGSLSSYAYYSPTTSVSVSATSSSNTAPTITSANVYPTSPITTSYLSCVIQANDYEQPNLTASYSWFKNGVNQTALAGNRTINTNIYSTLSILPSSALTTGDSWYCSVRVFDGGLYSSPYSSSSVTTNSMNTPTVVSIALAPFVPTNATDLMCTLLARDPVQSSFTAYYSWLKNGVNQTALAGSKTISNNTYSVVSALSYGNLSVGDSWSCQAYVDDGSLVSNSMTTPSRTIQATQPPASSPWDVPSSGAVPAEGGNITQLTFDLSQSSEKWFFFFGSQFVTYTSQYGFKQNITLNASALLQDTYNPHLISMASAYPNLSYFLISDTEYPFSDQFSYPDLATFNSHFGLRTTDDSALLFNESTRFTLSTMYGANNTTLTLPTSYISGTVEGATNPYVFRQGLVQNGNSFLFIIPVNRSVGLDGQTYDYQFVLPYLASTNRFYVFPVLPVYFQTARGVSDLTNYSDLNYSVLSINQQSNQSLAYRSISKSDDFGPRASLSIGAGTQISTPENYTPGLVYVSNYTPSGDLNDSNIRMGLQLGPPNSTFSPNISITMNYSNLSNDEQAAVAVQWANHSLVVQKCDEDGLFCTNLTPSSVDTDSRLLTLSVGSFSTFGLYLPAAQDVSGSSSDTSTEGTDTPPSTSTPPAGGASTPSSPSYVWTYPTQTQSSSSGPVVRQFPSLVTDPNAKVTFYNERGYAYAYKADSHGWVDLSGLPGGHTYSYVIEVPGKLDVQSSVYIPPQSLVETPGYYPLPESGATPAITLHNTPRGQVLCVNNDCYARIDNRGQDLQALSDLSCTGSICKFVGVNQTEFIQKHNLRRTGTLTTPARPSPLPILNLSDLLSGLGADVNSRFGNNPAGGPMALYIILFVIVVFGGAILFSMLRPPASPKNRGGYD